MAPPDLSSPAARAAYRRELAAVARPVRMAGVTLAGVGALLLVSRGWAPIPAWVPYGIVGIAFTLMAAGIVARTRYHARRMQA